MKHAALTPELADELAHDCLDASDAIDRRLVDERASFSVAQRTELRAQSERLRARASELTLSAIGMDLSSHGISFSRIEAATTMGTRAIKNLKNIGKVIKVATLLVQLAGAVASKDVEKSLSAVDSLLEATRA